MTERILRPFRLSKAQKIMLKIKSKEVQDLARFIKKGLMFVRRDK